MWTVSSASRVTLLAMLACLAACRQAPSAEADEGAPRVERLDLRLLEPRQAKGSKVRALVVFHTALSAPGGRLRGRFSRGELAQAVRARRGPLMAALRRLGIPIRRSYTHVNALAIEANMTQIQALLELQEVARIELDEGGSGQLDEARPLVTLDAVHAQGYRGAGTTVAHLDTGVTPGHPAFAGRIKDEACFCQTGCCPDGSNEQLGEGAATDDNGHGTLTAGAALSGGSSAPLGGAPEAELIAVKVLDVSNNFCCTSDIVAGLDWVLSNHPETDVVNMSLTTSFLTSTACDDNYVTLANMANALKANGTLLVAASGNHRHKFRIGAPACLTSVMAVGATWDATLPPDSTFCSEPNPVADLVACYSNSSEELDLYAPGGQITSAWPPFHSNTRTGTSLAVPLVVGCAAVLREAYPESDASDLWSALSASPTLLTDPVSGLVRPRLDCLDALNWLKSGGDAGVDGGEMDDAGAVVDAAVDAGGPDAGGDGGDVLDASTDAGGADASTDAGGGDASTDAGGAADGGPHDGGRDGGMAPDSGSPVDGGGSGGAGGGGGSGGGGGAAGSHDASVDAGGDSSVAVDASSPGGSPADGGCDCSAVVGRGRHWRGWPLLLLMLLRLGRGRRLPR